MTMTRREWLGTASAAAGSMLGANLAAAAVQGPGHGLRMNVVLFMTDQERKVMHFPPGWEQENLPGLTRLKRHGVSFDNAFTNACMCSPARSTWMTGYFPAQHGVKYTLEEDMPSPQYPQVELPLPASMHNIATVMSAAGYQVVYKGKFHLTKPAGQFYVPSDVGQYGFDRWNPQDAGANQDIKEEGGGFVNNDGRFMNDDGPWQLGREGALAYLNSVAPTQQPFFLIVSLVNPHDVLFYPNKYLQAGYNNSWLQGSIHAPETINEDLSTKPDVQRQFLALTNFGLGKLTTREMYRNYLNFYGNLMKASDRYLVQVLDALDARGLRDNTLVIRTADHGEMGLTHGGQRQKNFNFYEEALRIPLVYSNPKLFPTPRVSPALVSHVDFLPTIANLFSAPPAARAPWQGVDYSSLILNPRARPVQDYIAFTYDDYQSGQSSGPYPTPPNHIVSIREQRYKLAQCYDVNGQVPPQWEMYDLLEDPNEVRNLAYWKTRRTPQQQREFERLVVKLQAVKATRLQPLS